MRTALHTPDRVLCFPALRFNLEAAEHALTTVLMAMERVRSSAAADLEVTAEVLQTQIELQSAAQRIGTMRAHAARRSREQQRA